MTELELIKEYADAYEPKESATLVKVSLPEKTVTYYESRIAELERVIAELTKPKRVSANKTLESVFNGFLTKKEYETKTVGKWVFCINGTRYACDGHRLLKTTEEIEVKSNEKLPDGYQNFIPEETEKTFSKILDGTKELNLKECELPEYSVLNEIYKQAKANETQKVKRWLYIFNHENQFYGFDAKYLLDGMKATQTNVIKVSTPKTPAFMDSEDAKTKYMVCPVNIKGKTHEQLESMVGRFTPIC